MDIHSLGMPHLHYLYAREVPPHFGNHRSTVSFLHAPVYFLTTLMTTEITLITGQCLCGLNNLVKSKGLLSLTSTTSPWMCKYRLK